MWLHWAVEGSHEGFSESYWRCWVSLLDEVVAVAVDVAPPSRSILLDGVSFWLLRQETADWKVFPPLISFLPEYWFDYQELFCDHYLSMLE